MNIFFNIRAGRLPGAMGRGRAVKGREAETEQNGSQQQEEEEEEHSTGREGSVAEAAAAAATTVVVVVAEEEEECHRWGLRLKAPGSQASFLSPWPLSE